LVDDLGPRRLDPLVLRLKSVVSAARELGKHKDQCKRSAHGDVLLAIPVTCKIETKLPVAESLVANSLRGAPGMAC
jgi:poly-gamma-glutamate capsule biosynthesis protein CapA/YwtB (metallophosphatase superfamily)